MDESRRNFLKIAGCSALGALWGIPVVKAVARAFETKPAPGALRAKKWAMVVDIKRCAREDVRQVAARACHSIHNVPDIGVPEEAIQWIWSDTYERVFPSQVHPYTDGALRRQPVLVLCNHCERPPCVRVCPTQATFRREEDGIVMMDMHRCIGCRYCMAACPYGSRSFNWRDPRPFIRSKVRPEFPTRSTGVVEKCNFCAERLARGEIPACVEAVNRLAGPRAMAFGDLSDANSEVSRLLRQRHALRRKPALGTQPRVYYVV